MKKETIEIKGKAMKDAQEICDGDGFAFSFFNVAQSPVNKQCSPTLTTGNACGVAVGVMDDGIAIKSTGKDGYMIAYEGDSASLQFPGDKGGPVQRGMTSTLLCAKGCANGVVVRDEPKIYIKEGTKLGYAEAQEGDGVQLQFPEGGRGRVQKKCSPTLVCCRGGAVGVVVKGDENMKKESGMKVAGNLNQTGYIAADKVYSTDGMAPTIVCAHGGIAHPKIEVAGNLNIEGWHDCANEVNSTDGISPTICAQANNTRVKIEVAGELADSKNIQQRQIYSTERIAPTVCAQANNTRLKIEVAGEMTDTDYVKDRKVYSEDGVSPSILVCSRSKIEVAGEMTDTNYVHSRAVYSAEGISPTIVCGGGGTGSKIKIEDKSELIPDMEEGDIASMITPGREEKRQNGQRYKTDGTSFTVTCQDKHGVVEKKNHGLRIRYLTPRECWRLQGFPDWAFDAAKDAGMSKTALYTQAGNSIAVPCLMAIFKGMYVDKTFSKTKDITSW